jgi:heme-degrading monooxygenase HmoA
VSTVEVFEPLLLEAGFRLNPSTMVDLSDVRRQILPDGLERRQGIPIRLSMPGESGWLHVTAKLETSEEIEHWRRSRRRSLPNSWLQKRWWTAMYMRFWRPLCGAHIADGTLLCETTFDSMGRIGDHKSLTSVLNSACPKFTAARKTAHLRGRNDHSSWNLVSDLASTDISTQVRYTLLTHWHSHIELEQWQASDAFKALEFLGTSNTKVFENIVRRAHPSGSYFARQCVH